MLTHFSSLGFFLIGLMLFPAPAKGQDSPPPNIVLFYADDLGWKDLGIQGSPFYETPNIDRIGKEGIQYTHAYANAANCAPSRACLMTGLYTPRHGIFTVGNPDRGQAEHRKIIPIPNKTVLDPHFLTLPQFLQDQGYRTCIAGKWHLSPDPLPYGFDTNFGGYQAGHPRSYFSPYQNPALSDGPRGEHLPDRLSTEVSNWIGQMPDTPFFVYFPFYSVHTPIQAREDLIAKYQGKEKGLYHNKPSYAAMIEAMDEAVGKVIAQLEALGVLDQTLIIFTSDNGAHGGQTLSRPLRGSKGMYYEGGIRVPLLIRGPGIGPPGSQCHSPVMGSDLFPTLVSYLGKSTADYAFDGISIQKTLAGDILPERSLFWHFPAYLQMYTQDRAFEDSHDRPYFRTSPVSVIIQNNWKLLEFLEEGDRELYNLTKDPGETDNVLAAYPQIAHELYETLSIWRKRVQAPIPKQPNPEYQPD